VKTVDRGVVRLIATKRIGTGLVSMAAGSAAIAWVVARGGDLAGAGLQFGLFLLICFGGGGWSLRDGLRLRRELQK
jgi:hypothetical protein